MQRILIWDIPTRLFHWTLVLSFAGAWLTSDGDTWLSVHVFLGYLMLGLVAFRVIWGFAGTYYARFSSFWFSPREALCYLRDVLAGRAARHIGHNPTGSLAIYLLLLLTLVVGATGFFTLGTEEQHGAVAGWLGITQGRFFKKLHEFSATLMLLLVFGHLAGVVVESWLHKENLARSMLTGTKLADEGAVHAKARSGVALLMLVLMLSFGGWWFFYALQAPLQKQLGVTAAGKTPHVAFVGPKLADNAQWREECGSCHLAFHPSLLPSRSWVRLMSEQKQHFGSDLGLDGATSAALLSFMTGNAAERHPTEPATKIDLSLKADVTPLRITETPYWVKKHRDIAEADWKSPQVKSQSNCAACHLDAEAGTFEDAAMRIPPRPTPTASQ
jgi:cytochrome b